MIWTRDLDDLSCTRCAPTIAARPSRKRIFNNKYKLSVYWVLKYRVGGRANNFVWLRVQSSVSGQDKGNESFLLLTKVIVARLRLPLDHLENAYLISINCRCIEFWNTGWGGWVNNFVWLRVQSSVSGQDKGNESFLLLTKVIKARNTKLAFLVMADGFVRRG